MPQTSNNYRPQNTPQMNCLLVASCVVYSMVPCLNYMAPHMNILPMYLEEFRNQLASGKINHQNVTQCDCIIYMPHVADFFNKAQLPSHTKTYVLQNVSFNAYHPDMTYIRADNNVFIKTYIDDYNSKLIAAGFCLGYTPQQTHELFCHKTFEQLGYFNYWTPAVENLKNLFGHLGFNVEMWLASLAREGCFMYSSNHPNLRMIFSLTEKILEHMNIPHYTFAPNTTPPYADPLAGGAVYPLYPEIADYFGLHGDYLFRSPSTKKSIDLNLFIQSSYQAYAQVGAECLMRNNSQVLGEIISVLQER